MLKIKCGVDGRNRESWERTVSAKWSYHVRVKTDVLLCHQIRLLDGRTRKHWDRRGQVEKHARKTIIPTLGLRWFLTGQYCYEPINTWDLGLGSEEEDWSPYLPLVQSCLTVLDSYRLLLFLSSFSFLLSVSSDSHLFLLNSSSHLCSYDESKSGFISFLSMSNMITITISCLQKIKDKFDDIDSW